MNIQTGPGIDYTLLEGQTTLRLNKGLSKFFRNLSGIVLKSPSNAFRFVKIVRWQRKAVRVRKGWLEKGIQVPPIIILSITERCNLSCKGCYARAIHKINDRELSSAELKRIFSEAKELGVSVFVIAGGEPFMRPELFEIAEAHPEMLFLVFTNGMMIDDEAAFMLKMHRNIIPLVSMEGFKEDTDNRRGDGTYNQLLKVMERMKTHKLFFGTSLTVTRYNFPAVTDETFVKKLYGLGCKLFLYLEYTPISEETNDWVLTDKQRNRIMDLMHQFQEQYPAVFISVPGHEENIGGCISSGRGFVHISASGDLEPCPFAPWSDVNLKNISLKQGLQSEFLKAIRESRTELHETSGGCALWAQREWVQGLFDGRKKSEISSQNKVV